jgi:hypothetical protein
LILKLISIKFSYGQFLTLAEEPKPTTLDSRMPCLPWGSVLAPLNFSRYDQTQRGQPRQGYARLIWVPLNIIISHSESSGSGAPSTFALSLAAFNQDAATNTTIVPLS